jgi:hypothetical protein
MCRGADRRAQIEKYLYFERSDSKTKPTAAESQLTSHLRLVLAYRMVKGEYIIKGDYITIG